MAEVSAVERAAMDGTDMPTGLSWREVAEYIALRALYWAYRHKVVTRGEASQYKQELIAALNGAEDSYNFERRCWQTAGQRFRATEAAVTEYLHNRTLENADRLVTVLDGMGVIDNE
jgi:hypothetical protein